MTAISCPFEYHYRENPERHAYIAALDSLRNRPFIPPVILGVARYVISPASPILANWADVPEAFSLVTDSFWKAAAVALDGFDWPVRHPNDVCFEAAEFQLQQDLTRELFVALQTAGAYGSKRTDKQRRKNAQDIVAAAKRLRALLNSSTGFDANGDYLGLADFHARGLLTSAGAARSDARFEIMLSHTPRDHSESYPERSRALYELTLQDLLTEAIEQTEWQAEHVELDHQGSPRQGRFVHSLREWFQNVYATSGENEPELPYRPCVETASAILAVRHPDVRLVANPARSRSRRDDS